jgi:Mg-chelatase subunit ChlD
MHKRMVVVALAAACAVAEAPKATHPAAAEDRAGREKSEAAQMNASPPPPPADGARSTAEAARSTVDGARSTAVAAAKMRSEPLRFARLAAEPEERRRFDAEGAATSARAEPRSAGVRAGSSDDNRDFKAFLDFLEKNGARGLPDDVSQRTVVDVRDAQGLPIFGADVVAIDVEGHAVARRKTYPDGRALLFTPARGSARLRVQYAGVAREVPLARAGRVQLDVTRREVRGRVPLDIAFVIDTTGSMGDEIDRLKKTLDVIHFRLAHLDPAADVRFGLVEYKDRGDDFVTRPIPFTADLEKFRASLAGLRAYGGGDQPEDVQAGLEQALHGLQWRDGNAVKVAFLIGDAPPHLDYGEQFTYVDAMQEAARRGIKIAAVGCSGLDLTGEVVWREIAQYTLSPYVFLTRGERSDMEGSGSTVSHHVGPNFATENLEDIVVRVVKSELAPLAQKTVAQKLR